jgi:hypothetical protein
MSCLQDNALSLWLLLVSTVMCVLATIDADR